MYADAVSDSRFALDFMGFAASSARINNRQPVRMTQWQHGR
jgi:hypothetical protein